MDYDLIADASHKFRQGINITEAFKGQSDTNASTLIEMIYDLQAGEYADFARKNTSFLDEYSSEMSEKIEPYKFSNSKILDLGCGEMTTLCHLLGKLNSDHNGIFGLDISLSRLLVGLSFASEFLGSETELPTSVVGDLSALPFQSNSIELLISNHALEPNGGREEKLLDEIFRVSSNYCVLFEPHYENGNADVKSRMDRLGYIKNMESNIASAGGVLLEIQTMENVVNKLNPTSCFIVDTSKVMMNESAQKNMHKVPYSIPGTNHSLSKYEDVLVSTDFGVGFPIVQGIPVLRENMAMFASHLLKKMSPHNR